MCRGMLPHGPPLAKAPAQGWRSALVYLPALYFVGEVLSPSFFPLSEGSFVRIHKGRDNRTDLSTSLAQSQRST